jgi:ABC-2 type transport system permease protein
LSTAELELRQVKGPSALGGAWRRFVHLTWLVASTDYKLSYFGSVLGYLWSFMQPLLLFGVMYVIFAIILHLGKAAYAFPVVLLMNIVLFNFFQQATSGAVTSVVAREGLVRKMHFPRLVIPLATVTTAGINLVFNLVVVVGFMLLYGVQPRATWLLLPIVLMLLVAITTGFAMLLSALYVHLRDVAPIWGVVCQALFYGSPIFITLEYIHGQAPGLVRYYLFNPLADILQLGRFWMVGGTHGPGFFMGGTVWLLVPLAILTGICVLGYAVFSRQAPAIAEEL